MVRVVKHWNRLHIEVVDSPSLQTFRAMCSEYDAAEGLPSHCRAVQCYLELKTFKGPSQLKPFCDYHTCKHMHSPPSEG